MTTFASTLTDRDPPTNYVSTDAFKNHLRNNPHNEARFFHPLDEGGWQDPDEFELVADSRKLEFVLRGRKQRLPPTSEYPRHGIELADSARVHVYEFARYLAAVSRDEVLATPTERRVSIAPAMQQLLVLDDWHHPDLAGDQRPSRLLRNPSLGIDGGIRSG